MPARRLILADSRPFPLPCGLGLALVLGLGLAVAAGRLFCFVFCFFHQIVKAGITKIPYPDFFKFILYNFFFATVTFHI